MKYVITGSAGNLSKPITKALLAAGDVAGRLTRRTGIKICRNGRKPENWKNA
jgi:hypothetical protein